MKALSASFLSVCFGTIVICPAKAQIIEDGTTNTQVIPTDNGIIIENGDRRESNLFHSFQEFSVSPEKPVFFNNVNDIVNIFSRVTGGNISNIDGLIGANGRANLFLINPAGISFGENAFLSIGGSFYGTTANSVIFPDNVEFAASNSVQPILTVNAPIGLRFRENPGAIINRSVANDLGLAVVPGQTLALIGGNISLEGGIISVAQGNIELASVADNSVVNLEPTNSSFSLGYEEVTSFRDITLSQGATINTNEVFSLNLRGDEILLTDGAQIRSLVNNFPTDIEINITARELLINNQANISTITVGTGTSGDINLNIADSARIVGMGSEQLQNIFAFDNSNSNIQNNFTNLTGIFSITTGQGTAKNINLTTSQLQLQNGGVIGSFTLGEGTSGILTLNPTDSLEIINAGIINSPLLGSTGNGTEIKINTGTLNLSENGVIVSGTLGEGDGSDILIDAATEINLLRSFPNSFLPTGILSSSGSSSGNGIAGDITINTQRLNIQDGSQITSTSGIVTDQGSIPLGGLGGKITINADESLEIASNNSDNVFRASGIYSSTFTDKDAGVIDITTDFLSVTNGGQINSSTLGEGKAGDIEISTKNLVINNGSTVISATGAAGDGGTIKINATESIDIRGVENGFLGGEIITASANNPRFSSPDAIITGNAGEIKITTSILRIRENGQISVGSTEQGNGGTVTIAADSLILDNGLISANTSFGLGANVNLLIENNLILDNNSQITAAALNNANGGDITIELANGAIVAFPSQLGSNGNDIVAVAEKGMGGEILVTADLVLGIEERLATDGNGINDIDASSQFGLNGSVTFNLPDTNNFQDIINLSSNVIVAEAVAKSACSTSTATSEFTILGRGGLPNPPNAPLNSEIILSEGAKPMPNQSQNPEKVSNIASKVQPIKTTQGDIYPARGIIVEKDGTVILTAHTNNQLEQRLPKNFIDCN